MENPSFMHRIATAQCANGLLYIVMKTITDTWALVNVALHMIIVHASIINCSATTIALQTYESKWNSVLQLRGRSQFTLFTLDITMMLREGGKGRDVKLREQVQLWRH